MPLLCEIILLVVLVLILIGVVRYWLSPDIGFFESIFYWDLIETVFDAIVCLLDAISSTHSD